MNNLKINEYNEVFRNIVKPYTKLPSGTNFIFKDYVFSQVAYPLIPYVTEREYSNYLGAFKVLSREITENNLRDFFKVLHYFYADVAEVIKNTNLVEEHDESFYFTLSSNPIISEIYNFIPNKIINVGRVKRDGWKVALAEVEKYSKSKLTDLVYLEVR